MRVRIALHYDAADAADGLGPAELLERVCAAERSGFEVAWIGESGLDVVSGLPAALPLCAALAAVTGVIRIGTAVLPLPLHHPVRVAEDAATLDAIAGGRFELGVGLGADPAGLQDFGVAIPERVTRFEEAVALIRLAWNAGPVEFSGHHYELHGIEVLPKPRAPLPLWVGAAGDEAQRRAARLSAGLWARSPSSPEPFLEAWSAAGHAAADARLALLHADVAACRGTLEALAGRVGQLDLVLPGLALAAGELDAVARELRELRSSYTPSTAQEPRCS